ncbi:MAG: ATP-dependent Clp protease proteolytic subunit [Alphaproteobacteria bacterium]|nr:ATP-dependent Clp protease proteolytic subunit [Alphaproteobacteria bacterium]
MRKFIVYHGAVTPQGIRNLEVLCVSCMSNGAREITLLLCSEGGDVNAGLGAYNFLKILPIRINTHCFGIVGSIAATMFLAGERRTMSKAGVFSLHAASFSDGPLKGSIAPTTEVISIPFRIELDWNDEHINRYFGQKTDTFVQPDEAIKLKIVHEIESISTGDSEIVLVGI